MENSIQDKLKSNYTLISKESINIYETIDAVYKEKLGNHELENIVMCILNKLCLHPTKGLINFISNENIDFPKSFDNGSSGIAFFLLLLGNKIENSFLIGLGILVLKELSKSLDLVDYSSCSYKFKNPDLFAEILTMDVLNWKTNSCENPKKELAIAREVFLLGDNLLNQSLFSKKVSEIEKYLDFYSRHRCESYLSRFYSYRDIELSMASSCKWSGSANLNFIETILKKSFGKTLRLLKITLSKQDYSFILENLMNLDISSLPKLCNVVLTQNHEWDKNILTRVKDLYMYENLVWSFNLSFSNRAQLFLLETRHEKEKQIYFCRAEREFFSYQFKTSPIHITVSSKWKWLDNAAWDIKENLPENQIAEKHGAYTICIVVSSFSKRGYFEYLLNDYDLMIINLFKENPKVEKNYRKLLEMFDAKTPDEKKKVLELFKTYIAKLLDRNILVMKESFNSLWR